MLGDPREATWQDIDEAVEAFVTGAMVSEALGLDGVQIHPTVSIFTRSSEKLYVNNVIAWLSRNAIFKPTREQEE
jgi:hypothetical protein